MTLFLFRLRRGYTLIEFIVVLGILAITVGALTIFLSSVIRGTNKASISAEVKQNGQVVLDSLERQIRGATRVEDKDGPSSDDYIMLEREFGDPLHIRCFAESPGNFNSRIAMAEVPDPSRVLTTVDPAWRSISNDDIDNGVSIPQSDCKLLVSQSNISSSGVPVPAVVSVSFVVQRKSERVDFAGKADFNTTISLRQY